MSILSNAEGFVTLTTIGPQYLSELCSDLSNNLLDQAKYSADPHKQYKHFLWIEPLNIVGSLIGIALAPLSITINLISAAVFGLMGLVTGNKKYFIASLFAGKAAAFTITTLPLMFIRIVRPDVTLREYTQYINLKFSH